MLVDGSAVLCSKLISVGGCVLQEIEQKNIDANMEMAMETTPESFGSVIMLYINCKYEWGF